MLVELLCAIGLAHHNQCGRPLIVPVYVGEQLVKTIEGKVVLVKERLNTLRGRGKDCEAELHEVRTAFAEAKIGELPRDGPGSLEEIFDYFDRSCSAVVIANTADMAALQDRICEIAERFKSEKKVRTNTGHARLHPRHG
jgi:hypothetical protein